MSNKAELTAYRAMIGQAVAQVETLHQQGMSLDEALATEPLSNIDRGQGFVSAAGFATAIWYSIEQ
jgi:hypothetical protein